MQSTRLAWLGAFLLLVCFPRAHAQAGSDATPAGSAAPCTAVEIFHRAGCPHCDRALAFLEELVRDQPQIEVDTLEITRSPDVFSRFVALNRRYGVEQPGVPSFLICDRFLVGFDTAQTTGAEIEHLLGIDEADLPPARLPGRRLEIRWLGNVDADRLGLPLFTLAVGLIDGFNPCAMWVLLFLLSLLVNLRDRRRILLIAGVFVLVSGAVYFAFMAAWLNMFLIIGLSRTLQITVGLLAIGIGSLHLKDFFAFGRGASLGIPEAAKPGLYARVRRVIHAQDLAGALVAVTVVAVLVNLVELLCTAGLPALYTQILTAHELDLASYYGYLLLYNVAYVFDDALMVGVAVYTLSRHKLQQRHGRWLKLLSGGVVLLLGLLLVFAPQRLR